MFSLPLSSAATLYICIFSTTLPFSVRVKLCVVVLSFFYSTLYLFKFAVLPQFFSLLYFCSAFFCMWEKWSEIFLCLCVVLVLIASTAIFSSSFSLKKFNIFRFFSSIYFFFVGEGKECVRKTFFNPIPLHHCQRGEEKLWIDFFWIWFNPILIAIFSNYLFNSKTQERLATAYKLYCIFLSVWLWLKVTIKITQELTAKAHKDSN